MFTERLKTHLDLHTDTAHVDHVNEGLANARPNYIGWSFVHIYQSTLKRSNIC